MLMEWPEYGPDTLEKLCLEICVKNIQTICTYNEKHYAVLRDFCLPQEICDKLLAAYIEINSDIKENFLHVFKDLNKTRLSQAKLARTKITSKGVRWLCKHPLVELDLSNCMEIDSECIGAIETAGKSLRCLRLARNQFWESDGHSEKNILFDKLQDKQSMPVNCVEEGGQGDVLVNNTYYLNCPNLSALFLRSYQLSSRQGNGLLRRTLHPMKKLTHLDITDSDISCYDLTALDCVPNLQSIVLADVVIPSHDLPIILHEICKLKKLRHVDLSWGGDDIAIYTETEENLKYLFKNLPSLVSLDISGTNLACAEKIRAVSHRPEVSTVEKVEDCGIPGLSGRRLEFLGLLDCADDACRRENIPADRVTGDANEEQIVLALQTYVERSKILTKALNYIFSYFQDDRVQNQCAVLEAILAGMKQHPEGRHVQISGSASLYFIVKGEQKDHITPHQKQRVATAILDGMEMFRGEQTMMRNGCLTLCHFQIPELLFCYKRLVMVLLDLIKPAQQDFIIRLAIHLLNYLACQVEGEEKKVVGDLGAITTMLDMITYKLAHESCDAIMEVAWSTMWNVTDETPFNCERFMDNGGMVLFRQCLQRFSDKAELLRNMMGLLGNIAEVKALRPKLMETEYLKQFSDLLESKSDGIEVSYNAAGVISHIMSDGPTEWSCTEIGRDDVVHKLAQAIERWPLDSKRNINYRSFEPILRLLRVSHTTPVQHWGVWALCNLTQVYPGKYCRLLEKEKGLDLLQEMLKDEQTDGKVRKLVQMVVDQCHTYFTTNPEQFESSQENMADDDEE